MKYKISILLWCLLPMVLLLIPPNAIAFKLENGGRYANLQQLQSAVIKNLEPLAREPKMLKEQAKVRKMDMAFEYDDIFENYKSTLRRLGDEISLLSEVEDNLKNIDYLTRQKDLYSKNFAKNIDDFRNSNASVYIPIVIAAYIEVPSAQDDKKVDLLEPAITRTILEKYGKEEIFSRKVTEGGALVEDVLRHKTMGTLEEDGTKSLDVDFIDRKPETTKFLTIYFYRFKPFETVAGGSSVNVGAQKSKDYVDLKVWDISALKNLNDLYGFINDHFPRQYAANQTELASYIQSLKGLPEKIDSGNTRVEYVISSLNRLLTKSKNELRLIDSKISQLKALNDAIYKDMGIKEALRIDQVTKLVTDKQLERDKLEGVFDYKFILIEEASSRNYSQSLEQSVEKIFTKLNTMIRKKNVDLETAITNGQLQSQDSRVFTFKEELSDIELFPFVDADKVGVLLSVSVRYNRASKKGKPDIAATPAAGRQGKQPDLVETFGDLTLKMRWIDTSFGSKGGVYFSKNPISKRQFQLYTNEFRTHLDEKCVKQLGDPGFPDNYPANFPMLCVSKTGAEGFVGWLNKTSGRSFRLPTDQEFRIASTSGIFSSTDNIFNLVLE